MSGATVFGLAVSPLTAKGVAERILSSPRGANAGVGLVVTPNIQHIALLREDASFRRAYADAEIVTCDGFPVYHYARMRGCEVPGRVTGCDIAVHLMADGAGLAGRRLFFVVDQPETAQAVAGWADRHGVDAAAFVPPFGFERDEPVSSDLAARIAAHRTEVLFMAVGAPKSEVFVHSHRSVLPPCWALCVGQAVKMALGLTPTPPGWVKACNLEWFWRILLEPKRMGLRYARSVVGFLAAVIGDLRQG